MRPLRLCALLVVVAIFPQVTGSDSLAIPIAPISIGSLASQFSPPKREDAATIEAIRNTLAIYPFAIDGKDFDALSKVFTSDTTANYSAPLNVLTPLSTIQSTLKASLTCVTTQHLYGTQLIDVISPTVARSVTYFRAAHFGKGDTTGQVLYAFGNYQDRWHLQDDHTWRITYRNLVYMQSHDDMLDDIDGALYLKKQLNSREPQ
ncbi:uncharacterized protein N7482_009137 [Penicillium canariense]|uniref:SnoaL-like domain-containing protein n=1 Tax=Penicillium canariense TaxID=189055 RepID=A0A9W9HPS7_9EURO|nr:uncharacterized protein N7482_009137 [Penicillium canariense]KAJ5152659.1 hypothetical protein N7482_009137 [Penicillium canariense]